MNTRPSDTPRMLLAKVRNGDYAHPGDEEAIELVLARVTRFIPNFLSSDFKILDAGCGLGGTADYVGRRTAAEVYGIDVDAVAITHAKSRYSNIKFFEKNIINCDDIFSANSFQFIYMFNVIYGIADKKTCLKKLAEIAAPNAILAIFDYTMSHPLQNEVQDLAGRPMYPLDMTTAKALFAETGWELIETVDLTSEYQKWYRDFLQKLVSMKEELLKQFSLDTYQKVFDVFSDLLSRLTNHHLNGTILITRLRDYPCYAC